MKRATKFEMFHAALTKVELWHWHNQLMVDEDNLPESAVDALLAGVRWVTFEPTNSDDEGEFNFGADSIEKGGVLANDFVVNAEWAADFADFMGLKEQETDTGVRCWMKAVRS